MTTKVSNRKRGASLLIVLAVALTTVVAVGVGVELYARHRVASCLSDALQSELGAKADVGLGARPLLLAAVDHKVPNVTVSAEDATVSGPAGTKLEGLRLSSSFRDLTLPNGSDPGSVGSSSADVSWPTSSIESSLQTLPGGFLISGVQTNAAANTLQVQFLGGSIGLTLTPHVEDGRITMTSSELTALDIGLPTAFPQQIIDSLTSDLADYPLGLRPESIKVADQGLQIQLRGGRAPLDSTPINCSVF